MDGRASLVLPETKCGLAKMCEGKDIILVPQNQAWSDLIEGTYGDRIRSFTRYATKRY